MPAFSNHSRKYQLNEEFFSHWSQNMAYVLGFWFADGYMRHDKSYRITFYSKDHEHIEKIKTAISSTTPIVRTKRKGIPENCSTLYVHSKVMFNDLLNLGGLNKKSIIIEFPNIPQIFLPDFIRGYFDGDGSVFFTTYKRSKDHKSQTDFRSNFTSGSPKFLHSLRDILTKHLGLFPKKVCVYGNGNQWKLGYGGPDTKKLMKFMYYQDCELFLDRKAAFLKFCN